ncbi:carbohydrate ABC transporter permease [Clostridium sp. chh4-2]|uniref:carbohydrate ABC transporter permease n=1 Tax=Clostridium sp. chh4-2 TaxID=2067550 RepID=UPI001FA90285|nr:carbohydrate ABC transporter permease [Clostridium sp. chh4-2]
MNKKQKLIITAVMFCGMLLVLSPLYFVVVNSLKTLPEIAKSAVSLPVRLHFENYGKAWKQLNFISAFKNTFLITLFSNVGGIVFGTMAGYWICRNPNRMTKILYSLIISSMAIPFQAIMISLMRVTKFMGFNDSIFGIVMCYWGLSVPICVFMSFGAVKSVPMEIEESAYIDGCSSFLMFWKIVFPLIRPTVLTFTVINTFWYWNDYLMSQLILTSKSHRVIQQAIRTLFNESIYQWDLGLAALILSIIPMTIFFIVMQKNVVAGVTAGAVKG